MASSAMFRGLHFVSSGVPGYIVPDRKCLPCPVASGRRTMSCYLYHGDHKCCQGPNSLLKRLPNYDPKRVSFACKASSNNQRRNPDFSRQHKGSSRGKSRQFQERQNSESLEETDLLPSKNGPLFSLSGNQKHQATATPGRREKEIVELFRKVQAQLRARASAKEEKLEAAQQGQGERGTVDSLLKLLRKHSMDQGKKRSEDFNLDQPGRSVPFEEEQNSNFFGSNSFASEEVHQPDSIVSSRPASNFRRKSPVPRVKFQPVFSREEDGSSISSFTSQGKNSVIDEQDLQPESIDDPASAFSDDLSDISDMDETSEDATESPTMESVDLSSLKLTELRGLAKSRGIKGYSKLKKGELVELLSANGS